MYFTARINSFFDGNSSTLEEVFERFTKIPEMTHLDLNYPEHFKNHSVDEMRELVNKYKLKIHGLAMRFRGPYLYGAYSSKDPQKVRDSIDLTKEAVDACAALGGENVTVWLGFDGNEYPFQADYILQFKNTIDSFKEVCAYAAEKGVLVSIEYKPYEPRAFSLIDSFGTSMYIIERVGAKNLGLTLDYCHMLMKKENPAFGIALALEEKKVHAFHLNDGYGRNDDGMMVGSCSLMTMLECIYYMKKYDYDGMIYFDTFPIRENAEAECQQNIDMFKLLCDKVDRIGLDKISNIVNENDAIAAMKLYTEML